MSLILKNVRKSYAENKIIDGFSYNFADRGIYIISGKSGVGKTTLLRLISGLDREYDGEIEGGAISNVSLMFQEYRLFDHLSAVDNVMIASTSNTDEDLERANATLSLLLLDESARTKKASELSGGMKQRVAFARALLKDAPILLLDEPTKELDEAAANAIIRLVRDEGKRRLVIIVTHDDLLKHFPDATQIRL